MASATLKILLDLEDNLSEGLNSISKKAKDLEPNFKKMAQVGSAGLAAIVGEAGFAIAAFADAERSQRQLEHAVIDVSKGTMAQAEAISNLSDALQRKTGIDGDALKMGAAQLSTFGLQSKSVVDLTKSLADLTINQNGVNASSDQYVQSANVMAKALQGQFGILEKSGIRFTEAQQNMILYGKESEKVAALQAGLAQNLRETTDTISGVDVATAKGIRSLGEMQESIGKGLAPVLANLSETIVPIVEKITEWVSKHPALVKWIFILSAALFGLIASVGFLGLALGGLATAAAAFGITAAVFLGWLLLIPLAIAAIIAVGVLLYKNWDTIKAAAIATWGAIKDFFIGIWEQITAAFTLAGMAISDAWNGLVEFFREVWTAITDIFNVSIAFLVGLVLTIFNAMGIDIMAVFNTLRNTLVAFWSGVRDVLVFIWTSMVSVITGSIQSISDFMAPILAFIGEAWSQTWNGMKDIFVEVWNTIKETMSVVISWIAEKIAWIADEIASLLQPIQNLAGGAAKAFSKIGASISSGVKNIIATGSSALGRAGGGPVSARGSYLVGEHGPEMFVPSTAGRIMSGGGGMTIIANFSNNKFVSPRDEAMVLGKELVRYVKDNMRL